MSGMLKVMKTRFYKINSSSIREEIHTNQVGEIQQPFQPWIVSEAPDNVLVVLPRSLDRTAVPEEQSHVSRGSRCG